MHLMHQRRPRDYKELFNLRHSQARNAVERIFGIAKLRWRTLAQGCRYPIKTQAAIVYAISVLFNYVSNFDSDDLSQELDEPDDELDNGTHPDALGLGYVSTQESRRAAARRDEIAMAMWEQYQAELHRRNLA